MSLQGRRALITGGSRGIGRGIALALAKEGVHVAILSRTVAGSEQTAKSCRKHKVRAYPIAADVTRTSELEAAVEHATKQLGGLDILVTSAGVSWIGPTHKAPETAWRYMIDVNLVGTMETARLCLPHLRASPAGTMIFIGSLSSKTTYPGGAGYCASKHALLGFAGSLYEELRGLRVKVSTICPGTVDTDMTASGRMPYRKDELLSVEDVVEAAMYVARASPRACPTEIVLRCHHPTYI